MQLVLEILEAPKVSIIADFTDSVYCADHDG